MVLIGSREFMVPAARPKQRARLAESLMRANHMTWLVISFLTSSCIRGANMDFEIATAYRAENYFALPRSAYLARHVLKVPAHRVLIPQERRRTPQNQHGEGISKKVTRLVSKHNLYTRFV